MLSDASQKAVQGKSSLIPSAYPACQAREDEARAIYSGARLSTTLRADAAPTECGGVHRRTKLIIPVFGRHSFVHSASPPLLLCSFKTTALCWAGRRFRGGSIYSFLGKQSGVNLSECALEAIPHISSPASHRPRGLSTPAPSLSSHCRTPGEDEAEGRVTLTATLADTLGTGPSHWSFTRIALLNPHHQPLKWARTIRSQTATPRLREVTRPAHSPQATKQGGYAPAVGLQSRCF